MQNFSVVSCLSVRRASYCRYIQPASDQNHIVAEMDKLVLDECLDSLLRRLSLLSFISGESSLKLDTLYRLSSILHAHRASSGSISSIMASVRPLLLDWDRLVRASAFRCLRYCLQVTGGSDADLARLSIDALSIYRLESSKSSLERSSILRFVATRLRRGTDDSIVEVYMKAVLELILGHLGQSQVPPFLNSLVDMFNWLACRFPEQALDSACIQRFATEVFPSLNNSSQRDRFVGILIKAAESGYPVSLPDDQITASILRCLIRAQGGLAILSRSLDGVSLENESVLDVLLEMVTSGDSLSVNNAKKLIGPPVSELTDFVNGSQGDRRRVKYAPLLESLPILYEYAIPAAQHVIRKVKPLPPLTYGITNPAAAFTDDHVSVLTAIDSLASSIHMRQKSSSLNDKKHSHPELFLSVPLWMAVMDHVRIGRFSLQARRVIHGLFIHTFFESESLAVLDQLIQY